ncbi:MAG: hypothetical protein IPM82_23230 [Saprospiraceae bacterium]|nr:hypothetical protein [Saprospiraceae bacterium]
MDYFGGFEGGWGIFGKWSSFRTESGVVGWHAASAASVNTCLNFSYYFKEIVTYFAQGIVKDLKQLGMLEVGVAWGAFQVFASLLKTLVTLVSKGIEKRSSECKLLRVRKLSVIIKKIK